MQNLIDIDASLQAMDTDPTVLIDLGNGGFLEIIIEARKQRRLIDKYVQSKFKASQETIQQIFALRQEKGEDLTDADLSSIDADLEFDGEEDFYGLGIALADYLTGWRGFKGPFNKAKAKRWLERFGKYAERLGRQFKKLLEDYEEKHFIVEEQLEKNSLDT